MVNYALLLKPGIILGNLITLAIGFILGSKSALDIHLFLATLLGLASIIGSACIFNNYIDRPIDQLMARTKKREGAFQAIGVSKALVLATLLAIFGGVTLLLFTNLTTFLLSALGFIVYVLIYSPLKSKTIFATAIGSIAGAIPPVAGYTAASGALDSTALLLFLLLVFWQMPHFYAIALMHMKDYSKAKLPLLPLLKGTTRTKVHMVLYILCFIPITLLLTQNPLPLLLGIVWLVLSLQGFYTCKDSLWSRRMFQFSLITLGTLCLSILA